MPIPAQSELVDEDLGRVHIPADSSLLWTASRYQVIARETGEVAQRLDDGQHIPLTDETLIFLEPGQRTVFQATAGPASLLVAIGGNS